MIPTYIDSGVTSFKGTAILDFKYLPPESTWDGGWSWDGPTFFWDNFLDGGNFVYDLDYDLNNDGNWVPCISLQGNTSPNLTIRSLSWNIYEAVWDIKRLLTPSSNCKLRTRIKNIKTGTYSSYGYTPIFTVTPTYSIAFKYLIDDVPYIWNPADDPAEYPYSERLDIGVDNVQSQRNTVKTIKRKSIVTDIPLYFPTISLADYTAFKTFLQIIDYQRNPFYLYTRETNFSSPDTVGVYKVKINNSSITELFDRNTFEINMTLRVQNG